MKSSNCFIRVASKMRRVSISDYLNTLKNPFGVFRTLGEVAVETDIWGEPDFRAGNSAAIFTYIRRCSESKSCQTGNRLRFLKCYIRPNPHLRTIYDYIEREKPPLLPSVRLLPEELWIHSLAGEQGWVDLVEGEWTEGVTLDVAIGRAVRTGDQVRLGRLADAFDLLCRRLLDEEWAHGDLKPENIIVRDCGAGGEGGCTSVDSGPFGAGSTPHSPVQNSPSQHIYPTLSLIDCDAMWIPALAGQKAAELGTPSYRHPRRTAAHFDKRVDDYSMILISASLHAIALMPELFARHNTPERLLLSPSEIIAGKSAASYEMLALFAREERKREYMMTRALASPSPDEARAEEILNLD